MAPPDPATKLNTMQEVLQSKKHAAGGNTTSLPTSNNKVIAA